MEVHLTVALALLLASISASVSLHEVHIQRKPKTFRGYLDCARGEARVHSKVGVSASPWREDVGTMYSDFFATVTVGTPPQTFSVVLRTDATGMWIPSAMCPTETYDMCKDHRRYDRDKSKTYVREGQMMGYGGMVAELSYDTVGIAGQSVKGQSFAEVIQYNYHDSSIPYDGLLGLDIVQHVFSNDASIFTNMIRQNIIDKIVYGLYFLKNSTDPNKSGGLIIGGRNSSLFHGNLTYVNSTYDTMWQFNVSEVILLDSDLPPLCKGGCPAVPDSGSHFILSSHVLMDDLHQRLGATVFTNDHTYQFNCSSLHQLQPVYFSIGESLLKVPWQSYVDRVMGPLGDIICLSSFVGTDDDLTAGKYGFNLGDAFFTSVYVEFDADNQRMGFAQLISSL